MSQDAILQEIYKNRCIELFMSGMKMEDSRRFVPLPQDANPGAAGASTHMPNVERDNNVDNTPSDPVCPSTLLSVR